MILIGATARHVGKTEFAARLIEALRTRGAVVGVKVTTIRDRHGMCPRGGDGCGACSSVSGDYDVQEETDLNGVKDTSRLLRAGAARVFWLKVKRDALAEGFRALRARLEPGAVIVAESNSLRHVVKPGLFVMVKDPTGNEGIKPTAREVMPFVDVAIPAAGEASADPVREVLRIYDACFTSIVLAGGTSRRMGADKALLPIGGRPMIGSLIESLAPISREVIVSLGGRGRREEIERVLPAGVRIVYDERPDQGPLMGIYAGLKASVTDVNLVAACDIPEIDPGFITGMRSYAGDHDVVASVDGEGRTNALLALYNKSVLPLVKEQLDRGQRKIVLFFPRCRVKYVRLPEGTWYRNINTPDDYRDYRRARAGRSS